MPKYAFDIKLFASVRVEAANEASARELVDDAFEVASCNGGCWPNGNPILFEASIDGAADLFEIEDEPA